MIRGLVYCSIFYLGFSISACKLRNETEANLQSVNIPPDNLYQRFPRLSENIPGLKNFLQSADSMLDAGSFIHFHYCEREPEGRTLWALGFGVSKPLGDSGIYFDFSDITVKQAEQFLAGVNETASLNASQKSGFSKAAKDTIFIKNSKSMMQIPGKSTQLSLDSSAEIAIAIELVNKTILAEHLKVPLDVRRRKCNAD